MTDRTADTVDDEIHAVRKEIWKLEARISELAEVTSDRARAGLRVTTSNGARVRLSALFGGEAGPHPRPQHGPAVPDVHDVGGRLQRDRRRTSRTARRSSCRPRHARRAARVRRIARMEVPDGLARGLDPRRGPRLPGPEGQPLAGDLGAAPHGRRLDRPRREDGLRAFDNYCPMFHVLALFPERRTTGGRS